MSSTTLPPQSYTVVDETLNKAMKEASIKSSPSPSEPAELSDSLEDGEIREVDQDDQDEDEEHEEGDEEDDGRLKTVFDDARKFNVKHPLYSTWTLHYDSPMAKPKAAAPSGAGWGNDMRKVVTMNSVEEFWGTYNNIVPPSQLPTKANYYLFKDGIAPAWEDPMNKDGGKWEIQVAREKSKSIIDKMWLYTMLAAIGETFETPLTAPGEKAAAPAQSDLVTGVLVAARANFYRVVIWTRAAPDTTLPETDALMNRIMLIGRHFKVNVLGFGLNDSIVGEKGGSLSSEVNFESHKDSETKGNKKKIVI